MVVRFSTQYVSHRAQFQLAFEYRYFDVPDAMFRKNGSCNFKEAVETSDISQSPLVVPQQTPYYPSGNGIAST